MGERTHDLEHWREMLAEIRIRTDARDSIDPPSTTEALLESIRQSREDLRQLELYRLDVLAALADQSVEAWLASKPVLPGWFVISNRAATGIYGAST